MRKSIGTVVLVGVFLYLVSKGALVIRPEETIAAFSVVGRGSREQVLSTRFFSVGLGSPRRTPREIPCTPPPGPPARRRSR